MEPARTPVDPWQFLWTLGVVLGLVGIPALLGFLAGTRLEEAGGAHPLPWRVIFVAVGVGVGGMVAWRLLLSRRSIGS